MLYLNIIIKLDVWPICHCLGFVHGTMVCAVCLSMFLYNKRKHSLCVTQWGSFPVWVERSKFSIWWSFYQIYFYLCILISNTVTTTLCDMMVISITSFYSTMVINHCFSFSVFFFQVKMTIHHCCLPGTEGYHLWNTYTFVTKWTQNVNTLQLRQTSLEEDHDNLPID